MHVTVPLSQLTASRRNPRRVKPEREAHRRLTASIRAHGLLEPLIVQPTGENGTYRVIAGNRRLAALRDVYRGRNPDIACQVRETDADTADALSLSENFARAGLHPLDEAEAFAKLASVDRKGVEAIAADFGVTKRYVRQRMKLASLAEPVKSAYRENGIDTAIAEAFAAVPEDRQLEVWREVDGRPQHARHVQNIIANGWIDASHALFDVDALPESATSRDLFSEKGGRVLIERKAFMEAQADSLIAEREALTEDGWGEVVIAVREDVEDRLRSMAPVEGEVDEDTAAKLADIEQQQVRLDAELDALDEGDEAGIESIYRAMDELERQERELLESAQRFYSEAVKAGTTIFLIADPDGRVRREYRTPHTHRAPGTVHVNGHVRSGPGEAEAPPAPPTSDDLSDRQKAPTYTHQALAVREALLGDGRTRRRVLALILHEKVRAEGLAIRRETNPTNLYANNAEGFASAALDALRERRTEADPLDHSSGPGLDEAEAYQRLRDVDDERIDRLIDLLIVETVTANLHRPTPLVRLLARDLCVNVRRYWRPDAGWLGSYKKVQLAHLIGELRGPVHGSAALSGGRKKSELVAELGQLFTDAAEGRLDDPRLAQRVNAWLPANLRDDEPGATPQYAEADAEAETEADAIAA